MNLSELSEALRDKPGSFEALFALLERMVALHQQSGQMHHSGADAAAALSRDIGRLSRQMTALEKRISRLEGVHGA